LTREWVRTLPLPFDGTFEAATRSWLQGVAGNSRPDVLAVAMEYVEGAPPVRGDGLQIAGDADYGPLSPAGQRLEGADFNDYLGISWTYPDGTVDRPEKAQFRCLDCSGFVRMVFGYRGGLPLGPLSSPGSERPGPAALPRRAVQMEASSFGVVVLPNRGVPPSDLSGLQAGDLVFFDADPGDGPAVDHVGIYLGRDDGGHHRFLSSRKGANGPTLGDVRGASVLDGTGLYARAFRSAKRL
jgi:cell wall-associated NlpC family hydrolase